MIKKEQPTSKLLKICISPSPQRLPREMDCIIAPRRSSAHTCSFRPCHALACSTCVLLNRDRRGWPRSRLRPGTAWLLPLLLLLPCLLTACLGQQIQQDEAVLYRPPTLSPCHGVSNKAQQTFVRDPLDCSLFYTCFGNRFWKMSCTTPGTVYSVQYKVCVWKDSAYDDCTKGPGGTDEELRRGREGEDEERGLKGKKVTLPEGHYPEDVIKDHSKLHGPRKEHHRHHDHRLVNDFNAKPQRLDKSQKQTENKVRKNSLETVENRSRYEHSDTRSRMNKDHTNDDLSQGDNKSSKNLFQNKPPFDKDNQEFPLPISNEDKSDVQLQGHETRSKSVVTVKSPFLPTPKNQYHSPNYVHVPSQRTKQDRKGLFHTSNEEYLKTLDAHFTITTTTRRPAKITQSKTTFRQPTTRRSRKNTSKAPTQSPTWTKGIGLALDKPDENTVQQLFSSTQTSIHLRRFETAKTTRHKLPITDLPDIDQRHSQTDRMTANPIMTFSPHQSILPELTPMTVPQINLWNLTTTTTLPTPDTSQTQELDFESTLKPQTESEHIFPWERLPGENERFLGRNQNSNIADHIGKDTDGNAPLSRTKQEEGESANIIKGNRTELQQGESTNNDGYTSSLRQEPKAFSTLQPTLHLHSIKITTAKPHRRRPSEKPLEFRYSTPALELSWQNPYVAPRPLKTPHGRGWLWDVPVKKNATDQRLTHRKRVSEQRPDPQSLQDLSPGEPRLQKDLLQNWLQWQGQNDDRPHHKGEPTYHVVDPHNGRVDSQEKDPDFWKSRRAPETVRWWKVTPLLLQPEERKTSSPYTMKIDSVNASTPSAPPATTTSSSSATTPASSRWWGIWTKVTERQSPWNLDVDADSALETVHTTDALPTGSTATMTTAVMAIATTTMARMKEVKYTVKTPSWLFETNPEVRTDFLTMTAFHPSTMTASTPTRASTTLATTSSSPLTRTSTTTTAMTTSVARLPHRQQMEHCGIMSRPLIIGGRPSRTGQWPWQVSLQIIAAVEPWHRCGGVLIHPSWILTAAHCVEGPFYGDVRNWRVVLSEESLEKESGREIYRRIARIVSHPGYIRTSNFPNDVALLQLEEGVDLSTGEVQVACLPDRDTPPPDFNHCWISGWGETRGTGGAENAMNELPVRLLQNEDCASMWLRVGIHVLDDQLCVGYGDTGACYGDSGGPLMCEHEGRFYITGVMSWLINNCSARGFPNVFTRVTSYLDWIYEKLDFYEWWRYN